MKKIYLSITGGLGNQLFQLSAALKLADGNPILIEWVNSKPRLNAEGKPEISDFTLPCNVIFLPRKKFSLIASKSVGYVLRMSVNPRDYELVWGVQKLIRILASISNIPVFGRYLPIRLNQGVGFSPRLSQRSPKSCHLIGYFQTYKWLENAADAYSLKGIEAQNSSKELLEFKARAETEHPLVVHLRFGDYRLEESFGILTKSYYLKSVQEMWASNSYTTIWVFSDEIEMAKNYLSELGIKEMSFCSDVSNSATQTLAAMRLGKGFVIGNSSFSWWAARLSHYPDPTVIAPTPWFVDQNEPLDLIPPNWIRRRGHDQE
jgi:hypothetical protein